MDASGNPGEVSKNADGLTARRTSLLPKLNLDSIAIAGCTSSRAMESSDHQPTAMITVVLDPTARPEGRSKSSADAGAPAAEPAPTSADAPAEAEKMAAEAVEAPSVTSPHSGKRLASDRRDASSRPTSDRHGGSSRLSRARRQSKTPGEHSTLGEHAAHKLGQANRCYYQNKELLSPRQAAQMLKNKAAVRGDLVTKREADKEVKELQSAAAEVRRIERRRVEAAKRIQSQERGKRALAFVRELRLNKWAMKVVCRGVLRWYEAGKRRAVAMAARAEAERVQQELLAQQAAERAAAKKAAKEEEKRLQQEKEEEEAKSAGNSRKDKIASKSKGENDKKLQQEKKQKERARAASAAASASKLAQLEAVKDSKRQEERRAKELWFAGADARKAAQEKAAAANLVIQKMQQAKDEAANAVSSLSEGMQALALNESPLRDEICSAGGIPPLVAMLAASGIPLQAKVAAAATLAQLSLTSELNRVAIRKAGGVAPLIKLAALSHKDGSAKYVHAITSLSMGSSTANQDAIRQAGGVSLLVSILVDDRDSELARDAVRALCKLTQENPANCDALREAGGIAELVALVQVGAEHHAATDASATLANVCATSWTNQDVVRASGGIQSLIAMLGGSSKSESLAFSARGLANLARDNDGHRQAICEHQGTITRLVALVGSGCATEGARQAADLLCCLMNGNDERTGVRILAAVRRQAVGVGPKASFALSDEFPELLLRLMSIVTARLDAAVKASNDSGNIQVALDDATALGLPEEYLTAAIKRLESMEVARVEAIAARKSRNSFMNETKNSPGRRQIGDMSSGYSGTKTPRGAPVTPRGASVTPRGASVTVFLEAKQRLHELETAAAGARRSRRTAAAARAASGFHVNLEPPKKVAGVSAEQNQPVEHTEEHGPQ